MGQRPLTAVACGPLPPRCSVMVSQTFAASAIDAAGNASATSSPLVVTIDTVAPVVTVNSLFTNDPTPPLSGDVNDPDAAVSIAVAGQTVSAANGGDGTWSLADNLLSVLDDGEYKRGRIGDGRCRKRRRGCYDQ